MFSKISIIAFVLAVIATVFMYANVAKAQVVEGGLVSYWSFDDNTIQGNTVENVWGDNDGTIVGAPQIVEGNVREALEFNGSDYLEGMNADLGGESQATLEMWINSDWDTNTGRQDGYQSILMQQKDWNDMFGLVLDYSPQLTLSHRSGGSSADRTIVQVEMSSYTGKWTHIAGVFDSGNYKLYVNGNLAKEAEGSFKKITDAINGCAFELANMSFSDRLLCHSIIDEVRVYNRALSEDEVKRNMNADGGMGVVSSANKLPLTWGKIKVSK